MDPGWGTRTASTFMEFCYNLISSLGSETLLWVLGNTQNQFEHHKYWPALWLSNLGSTSAFQKVLSMDLDKWQICPIKCLRTTLKWIRRDRLNPTSIYKQPAFENGKAYRAGRRTSDLSPFYPVSRMTLMEPLTPLNFNLLLNKVSPSDPMFSNSWLRLFVTVFIVLV